MIKTKEIRRVLDIHDRVVSSMGFHAKQDGGKDSKLFYVAHGSPVSYRASDNMSEEEANSLADRLNHEYFEKASSHLDSVTQGKIEDLLKD